MSLSVTELVDNQYKDYSKYVLYSRAIPHLIDGLKPSQRKILYTAIKNAKIRIKTASLSGATIAQANYHHGDASLNDAITKMVQPFANNLPLLEGEGSFGSRLVPEAAAPRYTYVKIGENYNKYFVDNEVAEVSPDPEDPEPKFYLPLIPWVLVNGIKGIAVGFSTEIQPHKAKDIAKLCVKYLSGKDITTGTKANDLLPHYPNFAGTIARDDAGVIWCKGTFSKVNTTKINITEVPIGFTRESYVSFLDSLEDAGKISYYVDKCDKSGFNFTITMPRAWLGRATDAQIVSLFRLQKKLNQNLTVINDDDQLCVYENVHAMIVDFCDYRITKYVDRYAKYVSDGNAQMRIYKEKIRFIRCILERDLNFNNKTKKQIIAELTKQEFAQDIIPMLVNMPIYSLCDDEKKKLISKGTDLYKMIKEWEKVDVNEQFVKELKGVK